MSLPLRAFLCYWVLHFAGTWIVVDARYNPGAMRCHEEPIGRKADAIALAEQLATRSARKASGGRHKGTWIVHRQGDAFVKVRVDADGRPLDG